MLPRSHALLMPSRRARLVLPFVVGHYGQLSLLRTCAGSVSFLRCCALIIRLTQAYIQVWLPLRAASSTAIGSDTAAPRYFAIFEKESLEWAIMELKYETPMIDLNSVVDRPSADNSHQRRGASITMSKYLLGRYSRIWSPGIYACLLGLLGAVAMREDRRHE